MNNSAAEVAGRLSAGMEQVLVGADRMTLGLTDRAARARPRADRRRSGHGQDAGGARARGAARPGVPPHRVHARSDAVRRRRNDRLQSADRAVHDAHRSDRRQRRARRRSQSHAAQDAVGAARSDGRGTRHDRRRAPIRCRSRSLLCATQNPIEYEGTYPLPEAQLDRFMVKVDGHVSAGERKSSSCSRAPPAGFDARALEESHVLAGHQRGRSDRSAARRAPGASVRGRARVHVPHRRRDAHASAPYARRFAARRHSAAGRRASRRRDRGTRLRDARRRQRRRRPRDSAPFRSSRPKPRSKASRRTMCCATCLAQIPVPRGDARHDLYRSARRRVKSTGL